MPKIFQFTSVVSGLIEVDDSEPKPALRAQEIMNGFVRESISQVADEVTVEQIQATFIKREPSPLDGLIGEMGRDRPSTETPDVS